VDGVYKIGNGPVPWSGKGSTAGE